MAEFVLKNDFFEFNNQIKQQISGTAIGTKCAQMYACIFMDKLFWWIRYIDDIFLIWKHG